MKFRRRDVILTGTAIAAAAPATLFAQVDTTSRPSVQAEGQTGAYAAPDNEQKINVINLHELAGQAEKVLPPFGFHFIAGGAGDEWTMRENETAFDRWVIKPKYLSGLKDADLNTTILGSKLSLPVITTPMGTNGFAHAKKEAGSARGTAAAGTLFTAASVTNLSMEEIAAACGAGPRWFQIFLPEDRGYTRELLQRAKAAGYSAIVITVDSTVFGNRDRVAKLGLRPPRHLGFGNVPKQAGMEGQNPDKQKVDLSWDDVAFVQKEAGLPLVLKGVMSRAQAIDGAKHGCSAIWVSNHGGRGLDHMPATISVLPEIADGIGGKVPIIFDGGIRRGQDVFRAIALGAAVVAIGRPVLYGLALGGGLGVEAVYQRLRAELIMTMRLAGVASIGKITHDFIARNRVA